MYKISSKVRYSEIGGDGKLTIPAIINYFQDCYIEHGEFLGLGLESMKGTDKAWFLGSWQIVFDRRPVMNEKIEVGTKTYEIKEFFDRRNFLMYDEEGKLLVHANSNWLYVNTKRNRPVKYDTSGGKDSHVEEEFPMKKANRKIIAPENRGEWKEASEYRVKRSAIDTNSHVNNCEYVRIGLNFLPKEFDETKIRQLRVEYKKPAKLDDIMIPRYLFLEEEGKVFMELNNVKKESFVVLEFSYQEYDGEEE